MKSTFLFLLALALPSMAQEIEVLERGVDHRVVRTVREELNSKGEAYMATNRYVELASSMHYFDGNDWQESKAEFKLQPGKAVADTMPHKVSISANLNTEGAVVLETPDGKLFRSTPLLVAFRDTGSGEMAWVGKIQDCAGELVAPNQIVFFNAMEGIKCAIRFTVTKYGFEQDLVLQEPLSSSDYGLKENPNVRLELWSAFVESPDLVETKVGKAGSMDDVYLDFGSLQIGNGRAFTIGSEEVEAPVAKAFGPIEGDDRLFLVEAIAQEDLQPMMESLRQAQIGKPKEAVKRLARRVTKQAKDLVAQVDRLDKSRDLQTASIRRSDRELGSAVILDYSTVNGSLGTFTFQSDTTYYISGNTTFGGAGTAVRFEGSSVLKYTNNVKLTINNPISWKGGDQFRPVVMTAVSDHSVGEKLNNATLSGRYATAALEINASTSVSDAKLKNFRICNAQVGIILNGRTGHILDHGQFVNCGYGVKMLSSSTTLLRNCLFSSVTTNLSGSGCTVRAEHITANGGTYFQSDLGTLYLTNSLLVAVTNPGATNNFQYVQTPSSSSGVFASVGSGQSYLAGATYRDQGTTVVSILADIQKRTTYPPVDLVNGFSIPTVLGPRAERDVSLPDLGYHYDPLDYTGEELTLTTTLVLTNGVAFGLHGENGFSIVSASAKLISEGRPDDMNRIVRYNSVQEQPSVWGSYIVPMSMISVVSSLTPSPEVRMRFTEVSLPGTTVSGTEKFLHAAPSVNVVWIARDCFFANLYENFLNNSPTVSQGIYLTNNIWIRPKLSIQNNQTTTGYPLNVEFRNNLCIGGTVSLTRTNHASAVYNVKDNLFDTVTLTASATGIGNSNNGYKGTTVLPGGSGNDLVLTTTDYQTSGPLGPYYYNTTASATNTQYLFNKGSVSDAATVGFYHYTARTDQLRETNSIVDIGFRYIATSGSSSTTPKDSDGDGIPDYLEDTDGDGVVDSGELNWGSATDYGLWIYLTAPKTTSNIP
ncbi:MAG: hypothetical protein JNN07_22380 [Verrucomicrobiales bacterium]|nr:hypothetical protein [Verrucomicrobiales bacterium]